MPTRAEVMNERLEAWFVSHPAAGTGVVTSGHRSMLQTAYERALQHMADPRWASRFPGHQSVATLGQRALVPPGELHETLCRIVDTVIPLVVEAHIVYVTRSGQAADGEASYRASVRAEVEGRLGRELTAKEWSYKEQNSRARLMWACVDALFALDPEVVPGLLASDVVSSAIAVAIELSVENIASAFKGADEQRALPDVSYVKAIESVRAALENASPPIACKDIDPELLRAEAAELAEVERAPAFTGAALERLALTLMDAGWLTRPRVGAGPAGQGEESSTAAPADDGLGLAVYLGCWAEVRTEPYLNATRLSVGAHIRLQDLPDVVLADPSVGLSQAVLDEREALVHDVLEHCWTKVDRKLAVDYVLGRHPLGDDPAVRPSSFINYWSSLQFNACMDVVKARWEGHGGHGVGPLPGQGTDVSCPDLPDEPQDPMEEGDQTGWTSPAPDRQDEVAPALEIWAYQFGKELADIVDQVANEEGLLVARGTGERSAVLEAASGWFRDDLPDRVHGKVTQEEAPKLSTVEGHEAGAHGRGPRFGKSVRTSCEADLQARGVAPRVARQASLVAQAVWARWLRDSGNGGDGRE